MGAPDPRVESSQQPAQVARSRDRLRRGPQVLVLPPAGAKAPPLASEERQLAAHPTSTGSSSPPWKRRACSPSRDADKPHPRPSPLLRPDRAAPYHRPGCRGVPRRRGSRSRGRGPARRPPARLTAIRRALGATLARCRPLQRIQRDGAQLHLPARLALPRLRHRSLQQGQALRPVCPRAARRRPPRRRGAPGPPGTNDSPPPASSPSAQDPQRARQGRLPDGDGRRTDRCLHPRRPRADRQLCAVPRPQVRSHRHQATTTRWPESSPAPARSTAPREAAATARPPN